MSMKQENSQPEEVPPMPVKEEMLPLYDEQPEGQPQAENPIPNMAEVQPVSAAEMFFIRRGLERLPMFIMLGIVNLIHTREPAIPILADETLHHFDIKFENLRASTLRELEEIIRQADAMVGRAMNVKGEPGVASGSNGNGSFEGGKENINLQLATLLPDYFFDENGDYTMLYLRLLARPQVFIYGPFVRDISQEKQTAASLKICTKAYGPCKIERLIH